MENRLKLIKGICTDCEKDTDILKSGKYQGICKSCMQRIQNCKSRGREYIPYKNLSDEDKKIYEARQEAQKHRRIKSTKKDTDTDVSTTLKTLKTLKTISSIENYYQVKAENNPTIAHVVERPMINNNESKVLSDQASFVTILRECGCEIPEESLKEVLNILMNTDQLKNIFLTIAKNDNQQAILDLEQALNVIERKLQHNWEYNGFQEADDIKFKGFLTWRRVLKGAIFFWKKLYQTNTIIEMKRVWNAYAQDPNDKILMAGDKMDSSMKRFQITTESISTIFNTKRPFTRIFYATDKESAYKTFTQWMADRQLHENKSKTVITELKNEGERIKNG